MQILAITQWIAGRSIDFGLTERVVMVITWCKDSFTRKLEFWSTNNKDNIDDWITSVGGWVSGYIIIP